MSSVKEGHQDIESQISGIFGHNSSLFTSEKKSGPVAGWFVQKPLKSRIFDDGRVPPLFMGKKPASKL